ncbi:histidine-type phosphatase [Duganella sp. FT135W]|uniref:Multiple inositol polyphosphate phosphatase 1 n=1 Tax=Duganella flavida TaxID=2692175 RepID=A0A6L8KAG3_9BURK|nr:histidine-type phosphatase [Duganella flavida]MYM24433.1 histidine-type phosphatase [Duganella flavida]
MMNTAALALSLLLTTKTPYAPQQASASYEAPPAGYKAVYTQMLARHGSRGLSSFKTDFALYNLWQLAEKEDALTPLGRTLGLDIEQMMQANALLGYGVAGISKPGYGNETMQGIAEHTQLAERLRARMPQLFRDAESGKRKFVVVTSGKDRAVDSGYFFSRSLVQQQPALAPLVDAGVDRFTLYFHKLNAKDDTLVTESSLAYQRWVKSDELQAREDAIHAQPQLHPAAQATLARLFTPAFIEALNAGQRSAANTGTRSYTSADGKFTNTLTGDGKTVIANATDAALALYELYAAAADMRAELSTDFSQYMPPEQAIIYAEAEDAIAFYEKGPGIAENGDVTWRMAAPLLDDFFKETDAIAAGDLSHAAKLRFAHAEIVVPLASAFGLPGMSTQLPRATTYSYQASSWRGAQVAPMAANLQWDVYQNAAGRTLVRLLYNEQEADFKAACKHAKISAASHFYDYKQLKRCYK